MSITPTYTLTNINDLLTELNNTSEPIYVIIVLIVLFLLVIILQKISQKYK